jgi:hypothetical protein
MTAPGFTANKSLYQPSRYYSSSVSIARAGNNAVTPASKLSWLWNSLARPALRAACKAAAAATGAAVAADCTFDTAGVDIEACGAAGAAVRTILNTGCDAI